MPAGLLRRLGALTYDSLLLAAVLMIVTAVYLPLTHGEAVDAHAHPALYWLYRLVLLGAITLYYGFPWTRGGQTLGMATWRLRVERLDGSLLRWRDALLRLACAAISLLPAGLGFLWVRFDHDRRAWHDRLSRTRVVVIEKQPRR